MTSISTGVELDADEATLIAAVRRAGAIARQRRASLAVQPKGLQDIVSEVDRQCEREVRALIAQRHPRDLVIGEEQEGDGLADLGGTAAHAGRRWILDPLDGTKNFVHGSPRYGCALALQIEGVTRLAAVYCPALDELFCARRGRGATLGGAPLAVSTVGGLASALVASALTVRRRYQADHFQRLAKVTAAAQGVRVGGCAALDLCDVARGRLDAYFEEGLDPWDCAAGALIVEEAGGAVSDFAGGALDLWRGELLATNGHLAASLRALLDATTDTGAAVTPGPA